MTQLRVGDIRIDGSDVQIGSTRAESTSGPAAPPRPGLAWLQRTPLRPLALIGIGVAVLAAGVVWAIISRGELTPATYITRGFFLIPVGVGLVIAGALKDHAGRLVTSLGRTPADPVTETYIERLRSVIASPDTAHTVESLAGILGWSQHDVVKTLGWLQARRELAEDVDLSTGQFIYTAIPQAQDLQTRLRQTSNGT